MFEEIKDKTHFPFEQAFSGESHSFRRRFYKRLKTRFF